MATTMLSPAAKKESDAACDAPPSASGSTGSRSRCNTPSSVSGSRKTPCSGRKLKRRKTDGVAPTVAERMCVGEYAVPFEIEDIGGVATRVVDVGAQASWLNLVFGWSIMPTTNVMSEMKAAMVRSKRTSVCWKGTNLIVTAEVRGAKVQLKNNRKQVKLVLTEEIDKETGAKRWPALEWFVKEMYKDLHAEPESSDEEEEQGSTVKEESAGGSTVKEEAEENKNEEKGSDGEGNGTDEDGARDRGADDALQKRCENLTKSTDSWKWSPAKESFFCPKPFDAKWGKEKVYWHIPSKTKSDLSLRVKWLVATQRKMRDYYATGEATKVAEEDLGDTDDEL